MDSFILFFGEDFPMEDVAEIGARLTALDCLVPGFVPPSIGLLDLGALAFAEHVDGLRTILLVDRNLASRMAKLANEGLPRHRDHPTEIAINLMAFAQATNLDIEPGLAFHELADRHGNDVAQAELTWFRAADRGAAMKWIALAMRRTASVDLGPLAPLEPHDMAAPLARWARNYIATLRIAELALQGRAGLDAVLTLLDWMIDDFILAGPAFMFAARYFGPRSARGRMLKSLRAQDREKAILGARNAAWDITYLSEFVRLSALRDSTRRQYIFATADRALHEIASSLFCGPQATDDFPALVEKLGQWWPTAQARRIADRYFRCVDLVGAGRNRGVNAPGDPIGDMVAAGEARLRAWPTSI